jgi:hypothetical protein
MEPDLTPRYRVGDRVAIVNTEWRQLRADLLGREGLIRASISQRNPDFRVDPIDNWCGPKTFAYKVEFPNNYFYLTFHEEELNRICLKN